MGLLSRHTSTSMQVALAAAQAEVERLREDNHRLRTERLRGAGIGAAVERAGRMEGRTAEVGEQQDEAWNKGVEILVLQEMLLDLCLSVERSMIAVRAQLADGIPPTELDRRLVDRRRSDRTQDTRVDVPANGNGTSKGNGNGNSHGGQRLAELLRRAADARAATSLPTEGTE